MTAISTALLVSAFLNLQLIAAPVAAHDRATDESRKAEQDFAEGERLRSQGTAKAVAAALERYRAAGAAWQRLNNAARGAVAHNRIGWALVYLGEHAAAVAPYEEALCLAKAAGVSSEAGLSLHGLGWIYDKLGDPATALQLYEAALGESIPTTLQSTILTGMANHRLRLGEADEALALFHTALDLERSAGDLDGEATTLWSLSVFYRDRGEWQKAIDLHRQMLSNFEKLRSKEGISYAFRELGATYHGWGMNDRALDYLQRALKLTREVGDRVGEAIILSRMGSVYRDQKDLARAIEAYQQALRLYETAIHYDAGNVLVELGRAYMMAGKLDLALDRLEASFPINRKAGRKPVEAKALLVLADIHLTAGSTDQAVARYREALELYRSISNPAGEASTLYALAKAQAQIGRVSDARRDIERALNIIENLRSTVISRELRTSYFASVRKMYEFQIDLLMGLHRAEPAGGFDVAAFTASERARARSLLEVLTEARADIRQGIAPQLLQRERSLQELLGSKINRRMRLLSGKHSPQQIEAITREVERLTAEYETVQEEIRKTSPQYASLTQPQPATVSELQRLLGSDTVLLEYSLGESRSFLWMVTGEKLVSYELPPAAKIETAAGALYKGLSGSRAGTWRATDQTASELGATLLGPVASAIDGKRLVVVADGPLQYVPFAALGMPETALNRHEITYAPSATALVSLRSDFSARLGPPKTLAVFADPVFDEGDERVTATMAGGSRARREAETPSGLAIALRDAEIDGGAIARLPFTRREANAILPLVPETERKVALDFDASRALALSDELADYRIIHFATHALLDSRRPEFSGIVLSLVDRNGNDQDGFLAATEVFNLKLRADLVVLSGCRTALGQDVRGEGLVGLTRGFMYAGAPRVVASLWKVDDAATAELMKRFYEGMFGPRKLLPAAALREAQQSLANTPRWNAPYYWAAFVLHGEWN
jgi:CHAT domain-containing protein/tetratricopeptide (TPR) repeat protein